MPVLISELLAKALPFLKKWAWVPCILLIAITTAFIIHHLGVEDGKRTEKATEQKAIDLAKTDANQAQSEINAISNATASKNTKVITKYVAVKEKEGHIPDLNQPCGGGDVISLLNQASSDPVSRSPE